MLDLDLYVIYLLNNLDCSMNNYLSKQPVY